MQLHVKVMNKHQTAMHWIHSASVFVFVCVFFPSFDAPSINRFLLFGRILFLFLSKATLGTCIHCWYWMFKIMRIGIIIFFCVSVLFCTLKLNSYDAAVIAALVPVVAVICIHTENTRRDLILLLLHTHTRHHHRHHHHCYLTWTYVQQQQQHRHCVNVTRKIPSKQLR